LSQKNEVLAEVMEEHVRLKKRLGASWMATGLLLGYAIRSLTLWAIGRSRQDCPSRRFWAG
jgi:hypothetical protein